MEETKFPEAKLSDFIPSETKPQQIRRKRYTEKNLAELADSVKSQGVLEPVIVRPVKKKLELVAGERRWLAAGKAGLKRIPYILRVLSDEQVVIIQLHENLHRENPHPLDEAENYGYMRDEMGMSEAEIAGEVGKETIYVQQKLKLLTLPESVRAAFERKEISLSHIQEIAKYPPADHEEIFSYCFSNFGHTSEALYPFAKAKEQIKQHYLLQLAKAPFPLDSPDLHPAGLTCLKCHERTGAHPQLFDDNPGEKDSCYNRACYDRKVEKFVQLKRLSIATKVYNFPSEKTESAPVPVIQTRQSETVKSNVPTSSIDDVFIVEKDSCAYTRIGVIGDGEKTGKEIYFCDNPDYCRVHRPDSPQETIEDKSAELYQKEEAFQVLVGEAVRREMLKQVTKKLDGQEFSFRFPKFHAELQSKLWAAQTDSESDIIYNLLDDQTRRTLHEYQNEQQRSQQLFLLIYAGKCQMAKAYVSQKEIKELAKDFDLDYQMLDAVKRLELAPEEHQKTFYNYLRKIENGERNTPIPQVFSTEWKRSD